MMEIENWMKQYCGAVRAAFGDRVRYIGLQGSRGRGEAGPDSDIDVVCILDSCSLQDLETYRAGREGPAGPGQAVRLRLRYGGAGGLGPGGAVPVPPGHHRLVRTPCGPAAAGGARGRPPGPPSGGLRTVSPVLPQLSPRQKPGGGGGGLQGRRVPAAGQAVC